MIYEMRKYQHEAVEAARNSLRNVRACILKLATGTGKTIIASAVIESAVTKGKRVLFVAHTDELCAQAGDKLTKSTGIAYEVEKAERTAHDKGCPVVIASVQSLSRQKRLDRYHKTFFDLVITDEVHRGAADSYLRIYNHFDRAKMIGVTATPFRSDDRALGEVFDEVAFDYGLEKAIEDGWLVPIVSETIPLEIDFSHVSISAGDYKASDVEDAITPVMGAVAQKLREKAWNRKIAVFLPTIAASQRFCAVLCEAGFDAEHIDGNSKDRKEILGRFSHKGEGSVICNSCLLVEGWDEPTVDCIIVLTPTRSTLRYIQMIGRGTRLSPETGKENLYVPDFLWMGATHNLCHPSCLIAKSPEVAEKMTAISSKSNGKALLSELEEEAHQALVTEREEALAASLKAFVGNKSQKFDPVLQAVSVFDDRLVNWSPETKAEAALASNSQVEFLERHGFDATGWKAGYAERVMSIMAERREQGLASPKQVRCLMKHGYPNAHRLKFEEASGIMDTLSKKWDAMNKKKKWMKK